MGVVIALVVVGLILVTTVALGAGGDRGDTPAHWHQNPDSRVYGGNPAVWSGGGWDSGSAGGSH
jgi:hypothetical protein